MTNMWITTLLGSAGESFRDAIGVCAHEMNDPQLALFLCNIIDPAVGAQQRTLILAELLEGMPLSSRSIIAMCVNSDAGRWTLRLWCFPQFP